MPSAPLFSGENGKKCNNGFIQLFKRQKTAVFN